MAALEEKQEVIVLRSVDKERAKGEILELFRPEDTLFYSDIARRLRIDLPIVVEICRELEETEEIEIDADAI